MKGSLGLICILFTGLLIAMLAGLFYIGDLELSLSRWRVELNYAQRPEQGPSEFSQMKKHSDDLLEAVQTLANENGLMCKRDAAMVKTVAEFEEENRNLKNALKEACHNLQEQEDRINTLIEENNRLSYKINALEAAMEVMRNKAPTPETRVDILWPSNGYYM
jgi:uncharacterized coiled-coil DUF342 family protein